MNIAIEKEEIIRWINALDNPAVIKQIKWIKEKEAENFDFEKEWEKGISINEAREKTANFIKNLSWKK